MTAIPVTDSMRNRITVLRELGLGGRLSPRTLATFTAHLLADLATVESYLAASPTVLTRADGSTRVPAPSATIHPFTTGETQ